MIEKTETAPAIDTTEVTLFLSDESGKRVATVKQVAYTKDAEGGLSRFWVEGPSPGTVDQASMAVLSPEDLLAIRTQIEDELSEADEDENDGEPETGDTDDDA